jgi:hypothetical protein
MANERTYSHHIVNAECLAQDEILGIPELSVIAKMAEGQRLSPEEALGNKICMSYRRKNTVEKVELSIVEHMKVVEQRGQSSMAPVS